MVHAILSYVGTSEREDCVIMRGIPLWHEEQLHLAEWQALSQLEFLFNLTLSVDAKNMALEKLKTYKGSAEMTSEPFESLRNPLNTVDGEDPGHVADDDLDPQDEPLVKGTLLPRVTDAQFLLRVLERTDEVAQARQRGQHRREGLQCMREVNDAFGTPEHLHTRGSEPSVFGAAEHEKAAALAHHEACLEALRTQGEDKLAAQEPLPEATSLAPQEPEVMLQSAHAEKDAEPQEPAAYAKWLCDRGALTREQRGPVALIAREMQLEYDKETRRRERLPVAQREAHARGVAAESFLPLKGRRKRVLIYGGGGCGKTRIINCVLTPLFRKFYGPRGVVLTAFANKPARLIGGKTSHALTKLRGAQSLTMPRLRIKSDKERRALAAVWAPAGALVKDEFTQQPATLEHALAVRATYGREHAHDLVCAEYAQAATNYAALPFVVTAGDPLQFPPVPATASLLSEADGQTKEHRAAQLMFQDQDYVCELKSTMRFRSDPLLTRILEKMRTPGEDRTELRLTGEEWRVLQSTDINHGASLEGTELWYHSAFAWSYVSMAQWIRAVYSAAHHEETLFLVAARDYIQNVSSQDDLQACLGDSLIHRFLHTTAAGAAAAAPASAAEAGAAGQAT